MKKYSAVSLALILVAFILVGCRDGDRPADPEGRGSEHPAKETTIKQSNSDRSDSVLTLDRDPAADDKTTGRQVPGTTVKKFVIDLSPGFADQTLAPGVMPGGTAGYGYPGARSKNWFEFVADPNRLYVFETQPPPFSAEVRLFNLERLPSGEKWESAYAGVEAPGPERMLVVSQDPSTQPSTFAIPDTPDGWPTKYVVTVSTTANDHGGGPADATATEFGKPMIGELWPGIVSSDWFVFPAEQRTEYVIDLDSSTLTARNIIIESLTNPGAGILFSEEPLRISEFEVPGLHTIEIFDEGSTYTLTVTPR